MINLNKKMKKDSNRRTSWSISTKYETIVVGDAYIGKTSYLNTLVAREKESNAPVMISEDQNEFEFWIENKSKKAIFIVKDTASTYIFDYINFT